MRDTKLKIWCNEVRGRRSLIASMLGYTRMNVTHLCAGLVFPSPENTLALMRITGLTLKDINQPIYEMLKETKRLDGFGSFVEFKE